MFQLDNSSFMQAAQMKQNQQQSLFDQLTRGLQMAQNAEQMKLKKDQLKMKQQAEANDPKNLAATGFMKVAQGIEPTEAERGAMQYQDAQNLAKVTTDQYGNQISNRSLFDVINGDRANLETGAGTFTGMPANAGMNLGQGSNPAITQSYDDIDPVMMNENDVFNAIAPAPRVTNKAEELAFKNQLDIQKEKAKARILTDKNEMVAENEQTKADTDTLPILQDMLKFNEGTLEMPYAGVTQPVTRFTNPKAAENMALLKQRQLRLAAPLAKQLGVNPTDKDFQNTMNQIFNENESQETRRKQIQSLIDDIKKRRNMNPAQQRQERSSQARQNSEFRPTPEQIRAELKRRGR